MNIREFYAELERRYPPQLSCPWDNDGIMVCPDLATPVKKVLVSLDATSQAIRAAAQGGYDLLLTHHPMIFRKLGSVTEESIGGGRVLDSLVSGVSVISLHTRLDAGDDGVNDSLARFLGYEPTGKFGDSESPTLGRVFELECEKDAAEFALYVKKKLGAQSVRLCGNKKIKRVCVVGGAGGDFVSAALSMGADMLITGECSYNSAQDIAERGLCVLEAGHYHTEAPVCAQLLSIVRSLGLQGEIFDSITHITL